MAETVSDIRMDQVKNGNLVEGGRLVEGPRGNIFIEPVTAQIEQFMGANKVSLNDKGVIIRIGRERRYIPMPEFLQGRHGDLNFYRVCTPDELKGDSKKVDSDSIGVDRHGG